MQKLVMLAAAAACAAAGFSLADDGVTIGHDGGGDGPARLHAHSDLPQPVTIPPSVFPGIGGFATGLFGFSNVTIDEPDEHLYVLAQQADVFAQLVSLEGSLQVHDGLHVLAAGESMHFGSPFFDYHPLLVLPSGGNGVARFVFRDGSDTYAESEVLTLRFAAANPGCAADIGAQGGEIGADGALDNNDFVAFIDAFFASDSRADMGGQGGTAGADGALDNNDFVVFIGAFFAGC